jgi:putative transcriptional regulator
VTAKRLEEARRTTDWARLNAMTDEDIERQVAENPDAGPIFDIKSWREAKAKGRAFVRNPLNVATVRQKTGLSQDKFAQAIRISPHTLRGWEQGRRQPRGPARALLWALDSDPEAVMMALRPDLAREATSAGKPRRGFGEAPKSRFRKR